MSIESQPITEAERQSVLRTCILAAFADGGQSEAERTRIQEIMDGFAGEHPDVTLAYQEVLEGKATLADIAGQLQSPASRALAYEMAVGVCHADGALADAERVFLANLRQALHLDAASADSQIQTARTLAQPPLPGASQAPQADVDREADLDRMILNAAILNGALEIMPHSLATMAIIPLQMRLVYQIGNRYGYALDSGHIKDFLATVGIGLTSQVFEGFARRLLGGFTRQLGGGLLGGLVGQATGSAFAFATTYALGQVARKYYASGRTLDTARLKEVFADMLQQGRSLQSRYTGDIAARSRQVNVSELVPLMRQP